MNMQRHITSSSPPRNAPFHLTAGSSLGLILMGLALTTTSAFAQSQAQSSSGRYQVERANCYNGRTSEDGATCLKEANAALAEDRKGKLSAPGTPYQKNAMQRCETLPAADKADCARRVNGEGTVSGSVEAGGVLHELVVQM